MQNYLSEYLGAFFFLCMGVALGALLLFLSAFLSQGRTLDAEKLSAYECGFDPFEDCRAEFGVHFYLLGILFVIFDLEVVLLLPWAVTAGALDPFSLWVAADFILELVVGFFYVW